MHDALVSHVHKFCLYVGANIDFDYFLLITHMQKVNCVSLFSYDRKDPQTRNGQNVNLHLLIFFFKSICFNISYHNVTTKI
jgi:hypothetical protein